LLITTFARIVRSVALPGGIARLALRPSLISRLFRILTVAVGFAAGNSRGSALSRTASAAAATPTTTPTAPTTARLTAWATIRAVTTAAAIHTLLTSAFYATLRRSQGRDRLIGAVWRVRRADGLGAVGLRVTLTAAAIVTGALS